MFYMGAEEPRLPAPRDLVAASASKLWAERVNPIWWQTRTWLGEWLIGDRRTWRTTDGHWLAQIQRSVNRCHTYGGVARRRLCRLPGRLWLASGDGQGSQARAPAFAASGIGVVLANQPAGASGNSSQRGT
jgi:hypothetical protein